MEENTALNYSDQEATERIIKLTEGLTQFWSSATGWAPIKSAELLSRSRLDWQASLARMLRFFFYNEIRIEKGGLILAWTTLGSLTEGMLKLFLTVHHSDYEASALSSILKGYKDKDGEIIDPDTLVLEKLRIFFAEEVYSKNIRSIWKDQGRLDIIDWILKIQQRRNAIHAFKDRNIGDFDEFFYELKNFLIVMRRLADTFPYPDDHDYKPRET